ncbi:hypothetical protein OS493_034703 [Desmophyllum pertusum]|uniref:Uncharacterized protein n=1 Tax=Desmophyllum pertusum TaxID=174260 RepID=A0A9W9Z732_9CNID|nr:hypothetical protein OS493_034703 [Desmophyllum pertusum]
MIVENRLCCHGSHPEAVPEEEGGWRDQASPQSSLDEPDPAPSQGALDRPHQGGPLDNEEIRQRAPVAVPHVPPPESIPLQPGPPIHSNTHHSSLIQSNHPPSEANIPSSMGVQPYPHQSYPHQPLSNVQYPSTPFASPAGQNPPQTLHYQPQYQSPCWISTIAPDPSTVVAGAA